MEMTASMMLNSAVNDFAQSSRMSSFPSSESISSVISWHGTAESVAIKSENRPLASETVDQPIKSQVLQGENILQLFKVDLLAEKYGFLKKHFKYQIKGPVSFLFNIKDSQVKRRYSDFLWIHQYLLKKFPFRLILKVICDA